MLTVAANDYLELFESGNFADVDIICQGDVVLKAHKVILCTRSSWFKAALTGLWLEADSLRICVDDKDPATMKILLKYLYSGKLPALLYRSTDTDPKTHAGLESDVQLWIYADYFLMTDLKSDALKRLGVNFASVARDLCTFETNVTDITGQHPRLNSWASKNLEAITACLVNAIKIAYTIDTARDLHYTVTAMVLMMRGSMPEQAVLELCKDVPDFNSDLSQALVAHYFSKKRCDLQMPLMADGLSSDHKTALRSQVCGSCSKKLGPMPTLVVVDPVTVGSWWCFISCGRNAFHDKLLDTVCWLSPKN